MSNLYPSVSKHRKMDFKVLLFFIANKPVTFSITTISGLKPFTNLTKSKNK